MQKRKLKKSNRKLTDRVKDLNTMNVKPFVVLADIGHDNPGIPPPMPMLCSSVFFRTGGAGPEGEQAFAGQASEIPESQELKNQVVKSPQNYSL